jgi:hypothetical protein
VSITSLVARMCCSPRTSGPTWTPRPWCLCTWACHDGATPATPFTQSLAVAMPEVWQFCARACQPNVTSTSTRHTTQLDTACKPIHISTTTHTHTHTHAPRSKHTDSHAQTHARARAHRTHTHALSGPGPNLEYGCTLSPMLFCVQGLFRNLSRQCVSAGFVTISVKFVSMFIPCQSSN